MVCSPPDTSTCMSCIIVSMPQSDLALNLSPVILPIAFSASVSGNSIYPRARARDMDTLLAVSSLLILTLLI